MIKRYVSVLVAIAVIVALASISLYDVNDNYSGDGSREQEIEAASEILKSRSALKSDGAQLISNNDLDVEQLTKAVDELANAGFTDQSSVDALMRIIDQSLVDSDKSVVRFGLKVMTNLYPILKDYEEYIAGDQPRRDVILSYLESEDDVVRIKSFRVAALYYIDLAGVDSALINTASKAHTKHEVLDYVRILAGTLDEERTNIIRYLTDEALTVNPAYGINAYRVESIYYLSQTKMPPEELIAPAIEMLEGEYFGDPMLLDAIENYGVMARPYIDRLRALGDRVNERILYSRDQGGLGGSTFSRERYQSVLREIESSTD